MPALQKHLQNISNLSESVNKDPHNEFVNKDPPDESVDEDSPN